MIMITKQRYEKKLYPMDRVTSFFVPLYVKRRKDLCNMLDRNQKYVLLGSCFSQNVGERMQAEGYGTVCNPLGTLFNPESIRNIVRHALCGLPGELPMFRDAAMQEWRCWWANTRFRHDVEDEARRCVQEAYDALGRALRGADRLFLTLGTNVCYRLREGGLVVSNCQRQPDVLFREETLSLARTESILVETMELLLGHCPNLRITFTVSPFRYRKYGWHRSQLSKAVLLLAIDRVCAMYPGQADYFPSYEIMMDELRDYSFYAVDGLHPSPEAVEIIWNRLNGEDASPA